MTAPGGTLDDLLDQPSRVDPFHPHMATKLSTAVIPDRDRLIEILQGLVAHATSGQGLSPTRADVAVSEASQLLRKIGNAASNHGKEK